MGKRTHGPYLIAAIEYGDIEKVSHILSTKFRDKSKVKVFLASEIRRLASEYVEVPLILAATLADPTIIKYFVTKHEANVNFVYEYGHQVHRRISRFVIFRIGEKCKIRFICELQLPTPTEVAGVGFYLRLSVCLYAFFRTMAQKPMQLGSPNLT